MGSIDRTDNGIGVSSMFLQDSRTGCPADGGLIGRKKEVSFFFSRCCHAMPDGCGLSFFCMGIGNGSEAFLFRPGPDGKR